MGKKLCFRLVLVVCAHDICIKGTKVLQRERTSTHSQKERGAENEKHSISIVTCTPTCSQWTLSTFEQLEKNMEQFFCAIFHSFIFTF